MIFFANISFLYLILGYFSRLLQNDVGDQLVELNINILVKYGN